MDEVGIPMFKTISGEFQSLKRLGKNSNVWEDKVRISTFKRIR